MSSRVLRKARARATAKVVNYDERDNESDDDEPIMREYLLSFPALATV